MIVKVSLVFAQIAVISHSPSRIYGERAADVVQGVKTNPSVAIPVVLKRYFVWLTCVTVIFLFLLSLTSPSFCPFSLPLSDSNSSRKNGLMHSVHSTESGGNSWKNTTSNHWTILGLPLSRWTLVPLSPRHWLTRLKASTMRYGQMLCLTLNKSEEFCCVVL